MDKYFLDILPQSQRELWNELGQVPSHFVLYGGTAIAIRLGHRQSVDFDFFSNRPFNNQQLYRAVGFLRDSQVIQNELNTMTVLVGLAGAYVKVSFFGDLGLNQVAYPDLMDNGIKMASLLDLLGMKCATIPQRIELKDYLDIFAILERSAYSLEEGIAAAKVIYGKQYNEIFTLKALSYFDNEELKGLDKMTREFFGSKVNNLGSIKDLNSKGDLGMLNDAGR